MELQQQVLKIILDETGIESGKIDERFEDLGADSLDMLELCMTLEQRFNLEIPDEESWKLKTPRDVVNFIKEKVDAN